MKIQQLECVLEIVHNGNSISAAAAALHTSQPNVSRQLRLLEAELSIEIFHRTRNRIVGLTEPGEIVAETARRIVGDIEALASLRKELTASDRGALTVAATDTQARYVLPNVIGPYVADYPDIQIILKQGDPEGICRLVDEGDADLAIGPEVRQSFPRLVNLSCSTQGVVVVAPPGHPILDADVLTLESLAAYPLITHGTRFSGYWMLRSTFQRAGLDPRVVLSAIDADVCKTYVRRGLGIAILTVVALDPERDDDLVALAADHLFEAVKTCVRLKSDIHLRPYVFEFIRRLSPHLAPDAVRAALADARALAGTRHASRHASHRPDCA